MLMELLMIVYIVKLSKKQRLSELWFIHAKDNSV